jgi:hypothetical protein
VTKVAADHAFESLAASIAPGLRPMFAWNILHSLYSLADEKPLLQQVIRANRWASGDVDALLYNNRL